MYGLDPEVSTTNNPDTGEFTSSKTMVVFKWPSVVEGPRDKVGFLLYVVLY